RAQERRAGENAGEAQKRFAPCHAVLPAILDAATGKRWCHFGPLLSSWCLVRSWSLVRPWSLAVGPSMVPPGTSDLGRTTNLGRTRNQGPSTKAHRAALILQLC